MMRHQGLGVLEAEELQPAIDKQALDPGNSGNNQQKWKSAKVEVSKGRSRPRVQEVVRTPWRETVVERSKGLRVQ